MMFYVSGLESMGIFDEVFFYDDSLNNSNILGALYFDEFEFESMR